MGARRRAFLLLALLLATAFAGCTGSKDPDEGDDPPPPPDPPGNENGDPARLVAAGAAPVWFLGLEWSYRVEHHEQGVAGDLVVAIVAEDDGLWQLAPTNASDPEVVMWSLFTHIPPMGPVSKETFHPFVHGEPVPWFDFPLRPGKTWSAATAAGQMVNYTATATEVTLFEGSTFPAYEVIGERGGTPWLRYVYTSTATFIVEAGLDMDGDGSFDVTFEMTDARASNVHQETPTFEPVDLAWMDAQGPTSALDGKTSFTVPGDARELYAFFILGGGPGRYMGLLETPDGTTHTFNFTNANQTQEVQIRGARFVAAPGDGEVGALIVGDGWVRAELMAVVRKAPESV